MWDGYLGLIKTAKHLIELKSNNIRPVHSTVYQARSTALQFVSKDIEG